MKAEAKTLLIAAAVGALAVAVVGVSAQKDASPGYLGVRLMPVPEVLAVHLDLADDAGQMVINLVAGSGADKAGLARYDVITAIKGEKVLEYEQLVEAIRSAGAGGKLDFTVISEGRQRSVEIELSSEPEGELEWKYSKCPLDASGARAGLKLQKDDDYEPFDEDELPFGLPDQFRRFFRREHHFKYGPDDKKGFAYPGERTQERLEELEKRFDALEQQQAEILGKLDKLLEEK